MSEQFLEAMDARRGIVCAIGAGGKKTTLYALARAHPGHVGVTATVFMTTFSRRLDGERLITDTADLPAAVAAAAQRNRLVAWARPSEKSGRVAGLGPEEVRTCHDRGGFDVTLVKADGARMRAIKAPRADEPAVPEDANTVLHITSAAAFGVPLSDDIAHRPDELAAITGLRPGDPITPAAVARLLSAEMGALRNLPAGCRLIPVLNAVDNSDREAAARSAAALALRDCDRFDRVVLTRHSGDHAEIVDVITQPASGA